MPLWRSETRQDIGRQVEEKVLKSVGARQHPGSGCGSIEFDGSTVTELVEVKNAKRSHTLNGSYLRRLVTTANNSGKSAKYIVVFEDDGVICNCEVTFK